MVHLQAVSKHCTVHMQQLALAAEYAEADPFWWIRERICELTADSILLQASVYTAVVMGMTPTFLVW